MVCNRRPGQKRAVGPDGRSRTPRDTFPRLHRSAHSPAPLFAAPALGPLVPRWLFHSGSPTPRHCSAVVPCSDCPAVIAPTVAPDVDVARRCFPPVPRDEPRSRRAGWRMVATRASDPIQNICALMPGLKRSDGDPRYQASSPEPGESLDAAGIGAMRTDGMRADAVRAGAIRAGAIRADAVHPDAVWMTARVISRSRES